MQKGKHIFFRLPEDDYKLLEEQAKQKHISAPMLARCLVLDAVKEEAQNA